MEVKIAKSNKVYNKQYKDINNVEARITRTDNDHTGLKDANLMLDVRIPVKNRKLTLNDVVDMMLDGFKIIHEDIKVIKTDIHDLKVRMTNLETRMTYVENRLDRNNIN